MSNPSCCSLYQEEFTFYVWRTPKEAYNPECLIPTVKYGGYSVMVWAAILWYLHGRITAREYVDRLGNHVNPMIQMLFPNNAVFQGDNASIYTAATVQSWFEEHEGELQHLPWPAQSPDLNMTEPFWSVLVT
jgi:hypothetical protein